MSIRLKIAKLAAKSSRFVLKNIFRRDGGFFPGKLALKIDPNLILDLSPIFDGQTVLVTGTNGKTSVTSLLASCVENNGAKVICNYTGANMKSGVATSMISYKRKRYEKDKKTFGIFEIDEMWVIKILPELRANFLVLLNLFPDQEDRFGGIDKIQKSLINALEMSPNTTLIYNADDPNCQFVADSCNNAVVSFGMYSLISPDNESVVSFCPECGSHLTYYARQYAQLGNYKCTNCGFNRAELDYGASDIELTKDLLKFTVGPITFESKKAAEYVVYNLMGFITCADLLGCSTDSIKDTVINQKTDNGRMQYFDFGTQKVMITLAKNPAGFNQNIKYVVGQADRNTQCAVCFFANAKEGDGHSTKWIEDVNFSQLNKINYIDVFYGGEASADLEKSLRAARLDPIEVSCAKDVLSKTLNVSNIYFIANYTAMFPLREELIKLNKSYN